MKDFISTTYTFTPGASGVGTVNLSGINNFDIKRLVAIINQTRGVTIYATGSTTTGYTNLAGSTLTLSVDTTGQSSGDILQVIYNDPDYITSNASLTGASQALTLILNGHANTTFQLSGTWVGTVQFEASNNGTDWTAIFAFKAGDNVTPSTTATINDIYRCTTAGFSRVRAIVTAYTSGTIVVNANATINTSGVFLNFPLPVGSNLIGAVNTSQINGTAFDLGVGASGAGTQRVALANENVQDLYLVGQSAQTAVVNNILTTTAGTSAVDVIAYRAFTCQVVSTATGGTFIFEGSNDNVNFVPAPIRNINSIAGTTITTAITASATTIIYTGECNFRYIRLRIVTTITGGSIQAFTTFTQTPYASTQSIVTQATAGNLNATIAGTVNIGNTANTTPILANVLIPVGTTTGDTGAKTATGNGATQTNVNAKGANIVINLGTVTGTTPTAVFKVQYSSDAGTNWLDLPNATTATLTTTGLYGITIYPGITTVAGTATAGSVAQVNTILPRTWRLVWTIGGTTPSFTITNVQVTYNL